MHKGCVTNEHLVCIDFLCLMHLGPNRIQDKCVEWVEKVRSIIPSNIIKRKPTTQSFDNIDYKNKNSIRIEFHHTYSILSESTTLMTI